MVFVSSYILLCPVNCSKRVSMNIKPKLHRSLDGDKCEQNLEISVGSERDVILNNLLYATEIQRK